MLNCTAAFDKSSKVNISFLVDIKTVQKHRKWEIKDSKVSVAFCITMCFNFFISQYFLTESNF